MCFFPSIYPSRLMLLKNNYYFLHFSLSTSNPGPSSELLGAYQMLEEKN